MEKRAESPVSLAAPRQQPSYWYQAATLIERIAAWPTKGTAHSQCRDGRREEAEKTLQRWKAQKPFNKDTFFADRLLMDAISEQDLLALLEEPPEVLQERLSQPAAPEWVTALVNALHADLTTPLVPAQDSEHMNKAMALFQPFYLLLQGSIARVLAGVEALSRQYDALPFDPETILSLLLPNLFQQIQPQVSKTLVLELNIARLRGHLQGETSEERFHYYLRILSLREHLQPFLQEYCVLARQVQISSQLWANCSLEFLQRLCLDWQEILTVFTPEGEPGVLTEVAGGAGDTHREGRSVMILTFHSGWRLVYKPRSHTVDIHFQELLAWLNAHGTHPAFRLLKLLDKATYGWTEFITASDCSSEEEVIRFYERQGGYLALLYVLEATDFHHENVIAAGEHPLLIDLEALFHPHHSSREATTRLAQDLLQHSVLRIALLPQRILSNDENEGIDISGLGQIEGQLSPRPLPLWEGAGTDEMRLVHRRVELRGSKNRPRLHEQEVQPLDYIESIIGGFTAIYHLLMTNRDELLTLVLSRFAHDEVRFVARATRAYALLLQESFHPNLLRDALKRERFLDRLWMGVEYQPSLAQLIPAERADLLRGDIPLFTTRPESRDLWTSRGECIPAFFAESGLELVSKRLQQLGKEDLRIQTWMIRASFTSVAKLSISTERPARYDGREQPADTSSIRERLLGEARAIGDRLCACALRDEERADWFGLTFVREREWQITPASLDLYSGLPGILLFLSYLGMITEEARYTALAQAGLKTLRTSIQQNKEFLEQGGIGAFTGLGSCLYLYAHLAVIWKDASLLREAEELMQQLSGQIEQDEKFDLVDGAAGCIASLLNMHTIAPSIQTLKMATRCGDHLLACTHPVKEHLGWKQRQQDVPLAGFSHGVAGIAWSLLRLAASSGEERFRHTALASLAYERSLFSPEQGNWLDLRQRPDTESRQREQVKPEQEREARCGMSWSHGAPGIALGRLVSLPYLDNTTLHTELEVALETTIAYGFGYCHEQVGSNHSLAHGDCGNLETILIAAQTLRTQHLYECLKRLTSQLLESINRHGWIMGVPLNIETPGLMPGLAGIGYQCLRLAEPERVPSVLALAPPSAPCRF